MKYRIKRTLIGLLISVLGFSLVTFIGCTGKDMKVVTGTIEQTDDGLVLRTDTNEYTTAGADIAALVGKKVEVTGMITEGTAGKIFNIVGIRALKG
ncbi:MAG: hypothetical protein DSY90_09410 [Deltaproteobacteria bacterium]|nr:MAG: hypothetical protein DSY90_09410 [Deltaproteobacteria bacterium]